jgi:ribosomal protein S18 acetylase RimI-like enzyme
VGLLSNLLGFRDGRADDDGPVHVRPAADGELEAAMALILSPPGASADARAAEEFVSFARERGISLDGLHVAERGGRVVWAALPVVSPGRTMLILSPPGGVGKATEDEGRQVIEAVCGYYAGRGVHLAQSLIDPHDAGLERVFAEAGFTRMAELYYLHAQPPADDVMPSLPAGMEWVAYEPSREELFGRAVLESYKASLDCPALNGRREVADVLAGHRATGTFDPSIWYLLREGGESLGVLLLSESLRADAVELVYVGLAPAARGRGLGELMIRQALAVTARRRQPRLCLAVDAENVPALKLYYRHGMRRVGSKLALMRDLRVGAGR